MFRTLLIALTLGFLSVSTSLASVPEDSIGIRIIAGKAYILHKLDPGESLASLSRRYACSVANIKLANNLTTDSPPVGTILKVPSAKAGGNVSLQDYMDRTSNDETPRSTGGSTSVNTPATPARTGVAAAGGGQYHTIEKGQTLYSISRLYSVTVDQLKAWNHLTSNDIAAGSKLLVNPNGVTTVAPKVVTETPVITPPVQTQPKVESGPAQDPPAVVTPPTPKVNAPPAEEKTEEVVHIVKRGENLSVIARNYGTTVAEIKRVNHLSSDAIQAGQRLIIPVKAPAVTNRPTVTPVAPVTQPAVTNYHEPEPLIDRLSTGDTPGDEDTPSGDPMTSVSEETPELEVVSVTKNITPPPGAKTKLYTDPWLKKTYLRVEEKGRAGLIEDFSTDQTRFYAFHRTLPVGSIIRIDFPEKNQTLLVEVISALPATDPNMVRVTSRVAEYLMLNGAGAQVEIRYSIAQE